METNNYNMRFLEQHFQNDKEIQACLQEATPLEAIKCLWRSSTKQWKETRTVDVKTHKRPQEYGKNCVDFFCKIVFIKPSNEEERLCLFDLQDETDKFLTKKYNKDKLGDEIVDTFSLMTFEYDLFRQTVLSTPASEETQYQSDPYVSSTHDAKRKEHPYEKEEEKSSEEVHVEKKQKSDEHDQKEEWLTLEEAKKSILEFVDNRTIDWRSQNAVVMERELILMMLQIPSTGLIESTDEVEKNNSLAKSRIRRLEREFHPDKNKAKGESEKALYADAHSFLVDIKSKFE